MGIPYVDFTLLDTDETKNSFNTYGLILSSQDIGLPPVKTNYIEIEGRQGSLDMSEAFDEILYEDRTLTFIFNIVNDIYAWDELRTHIANDLHGKRCKIVVYSDTDFYYIGRCSVDKYQSSKGLGTITVKCICEPFKYSQYIDKDITLGTTEYATVTETFTIKGKPTEIYCNTANATSSSVTFKIDSKSQFTVPKQSGGYYPVLVGSGQHTIKVTGLGSVTITYQEKHI